MQIVHEPGFFKPKLTSTIAIKNYNKKLHNKKIEYIEYFINKKNVIQYINSDEGGRFYKNETRNSIFILKKNDDLKLSKNFIWVSHNQIINLINRNLLTIEARNLFASFNIDKIN